MLHVQPEIFLKIEHHVVRLPPYIYEEATKHWIDQDGLFDTAHHAIPSTYSSCRKYINILDVDFVSILTFYNSI